MFYFIIIKLRGKINIGKLICPICGKATSSFMGNYRKYRSHKLYAKELKEDKIMRREKCNE